MFWPPIPILTVEVVLLRMSRGQPTFFATNTDERDQFRNHLCKALWWLKLVVWNSVLLLWTVPWHSSGIAFSVSTDPSHFHTLLNWSWMAHQAYIFDLTVFWIRWWIKKIHNWNTDYANGTSTLYMYHLTRATQWYFYNEFLHWHLECVLVEVLLYWSDWGKNALCRRRCISCSFLLLFFTSLLYAAFLLYSVGLWSWFSCDMLAVPNSGICTYGISPDVIIFCGWLGSKYQLTNKITSERWCCGDCTAWCSWSC